MMTDNTDMNRQLTFLVFGATGGTGKHFVAKALEGGHRVRALVRDPTKLSASGPKVDVHQGSITDVANVDDLVRGVDVVVSMLGDMQAQKESKINTAFVKKLVPAMRKHDVKRFFYQAGGLSRPYMGQLTPILWMIRYTIARGYEGQHQDNEAVMEYLSTEAEDVEWIVHRAGINGDGPSKGTLERSSTNFSVANFRDCADYNYRTILDPSAIHTSDFSHYS